MGYILSHGATIHYEEYGGGQPLILLPGLLGNIESTWRMFLPEFAKRFHTVVVDLRGHGKTNNPEGVFTLGLLVDDLKTLVETLGFERVFICGYSLGGYIGLEYGIRHPGMVAGLVMHGTKFFWDEVTAKRTVAQMDPEQIRLHNPEWGETLRAEHPGGERWVELLQSARSFVSGLTGNGISFPAVTTARFPVLVSVGEKDELIPSEEAETLAQRLPFGRVTIVPGTRHAMKTVDKNAFISMVLDFFDEQGNEVRNPGKF